MNRFNKSFKIPFVLVFYFYIGTGTYIVPSTFLIRLTDRYLSESKTIIVVSYFKTC
jgi:hypothetical protein